MHEPRPTSVAKSRKLPHWMGYTDVDNIFNSMYLPTTAGRYLLDRHLPLIWPETLRLS